MIKIKCFVLDINKENILSLPISEAFYLPKELFKFIGLEIGKSVGSFGSYKMCLYIMSEEWEGNRHNRKIVIRKGDEVILSEDERFIGVRRMYDENYFVIDQGWIKGEK